MKNIFINVVSLILSLIFVSLPILLYLIKNTSFFDENRTMFSFGLVWIPFFIIKPIVEKFLNKDED